MTRAMQSDTESDRVVEQGWLISFSSLVSIFPPPLFHVRSSQGSGSNYKESSVSLFPSLF